MNRVTIVGLAVATTAALTAFAWWAHLAGLMVGAGLAVWGSRDRLADLRPTVAAEPVGPRGAHLVPRPHYPGRAYDYVPPEAEDGAA